MLPSVHSLNYYYLTGKYRSTLFRGHSQLHKLLLLHDRAIHNRREAENMQLVLPILEPVKPVAPADFSTPPLSGTISPDRSSITGNSTSTAKPSGESLSQATLSSATAPALASGAQYSSTSKRKLPTETEAAPEKPTKRYRCRYGRAHKGAGFSAEILRKHMRHLHRIFFRPDDDESKVLRCIHCRRLYKRGESGISCNGDAVCHIAPKQARAASVQWPQTAQEVADTLVDARRKPKVPPSRDVCIYPGDDEEEFRERLSRAMRHKIDGARASS